MSDVKAIVPSQIYDLEGPGGNIPRGGGRIASENQWYAITGRVTKLRVEDDGDLHLVVADASGNRPGEVVIEIPLGDRWCELRKMVFSWTDAWFPFATARSPFRLTQKPIITATGKAFYDTDHSGNTRSNKRGYDQKTAVWEIHPVMQLSVGNSKVTAAPRQIQPQIMPQIAATPTAIVPTPTAAPQEFVTITQPLTIQIPYGQTVLSRGMKLQIVSRDASMVRVRYMNEIYAVPISSTDLR